MKNVGLLFGSLLITFVAVIAVAFLFTKKANAPVLPSEPAVVLADGRNSKGKVDAKVTIVEFSDMQCPACKAVQPLLEDITKSASDSVRLAYRHFPLRSTHKNAFIAAKATEAAANQGKFWEYHDKLFATQQEWEEEGDPLPKFEAYATELKLDVEKWKKDMAEKSLEDRITADEKDGNTLGVDATPTFYVNNVKTDVSQLFTTVTNLLSQ